MARQPKCLKWWIVFLHGVDWKVLDKKKFSAFTKDDAKELGKSHWNLENTEHLTATLDVPENGFLFRENLSVIQYNQDNQGKSQKRKLL